MHSRSVLVAAQAIYGGSLGQLLQGGHDEGKDQGEGWTQLRQGYWILVDPVSGLIS